MGATVQHKRGLFAKFSNDPNILTSRGNFREVGRCLPLLLQGHPRPSRPPGNKLSRDLRFPSHFRSVAAFALSDCRFLCPPPGLDANWWHLSDQRCPDPSARCSGVSPWCPHGAASTRAGAGVMWVTAAALGQEPLWYSRETLEELPQHFAGMEKCFSQRTALYFFSYCLLSCARLKCKKFPPSKIFQQLVRRL